MAFRCPRDRFQIDPNHTGYLNSTIGYLNSTTVDDLNFTLENSNATVEFSNCKISDVSYWWVECPVMGLLCVVGLVANSLALMVWRSSREHKHSLFLLQALAITDNFYLLVALLVLPIRVSLPEKRDFFAEISPLTSYLLNTAQSLCILMIVLLTTERYIYVCHPFQASQILRKTRKCLLVGLVYAFSFLYNLPYMACYCVLQIHRGNTTSAYKVMRSWVNSDLLIEVYEHGARFTLMFVLPLLVLAVMSHRLVRDIRITRRRETVVSSQAQSDSNGEKTTTLLTIIAFIFIVCRSLEMIYLIFNLLLLDYCTLFQIDVIAPISHLLLVVNSSANFFVYFIFGNQFRKRFFHMIRFRHF